MMMMEEKSVLQPPSVCTVRRARVWMSALAMSSNLQLLLVNKTVIYFQSYLFIRNLSKDLFYFELKKKNKES